MSTKPTKTPLDLRSPVEWDNTREVLDSVKASSIKASKAAHEVFEALRSGSIAIADATELSNAIGKVNGADSNTVKAVLTEIMLNKLELAHTEKQFEAIEA